MHSPWTLVVDPEAVQQAVQLPHPAPGPPVESEHEIPGDRVVAHPGGRDPVGAVQVPDRLVVLVPFHEMRQDGSWSRHLAEATLTHDLSLPVALTTKRGLVREMRDDERY